MNHFWDTVETIPEGFGFPYYGTLHMAFLFALVIFAALCSAAYRKADTKQREKLRKLFAVLLLADELFKMVCLFIGGNYIAKYLPFHLCSINIFLIAVHAWKPSKTLDNFLYIACIPGAAAAMLFPTWSTLPVANFMFWHSFTVHFLLVTYPLMLTIGGDIRPSLRDLPKCLLFLLLLAIPIYGINLLLDTNFMFLMYPEPGNPLLIFQELWGNHLLGYPILIAAVVIVMFIPIAISHRLKKPVAKS